jgi:aldehyde dehydrogenase (NAD+)
MSEPTAETEREADLAALLARQRRRARALRTGGIGPRREALERLHAAVARNRDGLARALAHDLGKPLLEVEVSEFWPCELAHREISRRLARWMRPERVPVPWPWWGARAFVRPEPRGCVLVLAPWNYPLALTLVPLLEALAAGNTVVLKPSEHAPESARVLARLVAEAFPDDWATVITGGAETARRLLALPFDHVFFTGGPETGAHVRAAAARSGASCTLELGGKSPALVLDARGLERAARTILWAKWLNAGQTCIAPDHVLVPRALAGPFVDALARAAKSWGFGPESPLTAVSPRARERLARLLREDPRPPVLVVGADDPVRGRCALRVLLDPPAEGALGTEEIFGPVLPVWSYERLEDALERLESRGAPLVCYLFGGTSAARARVEEAVSAGAVVSGTALVQFLAPALPFGGVGASGLGAYHGRAGFRTFSHEKVVFREPWERLALFRPWDGKRVRRLVALLRRSLGRSTFGPLAAETDAKEESAAPHIR